MKGINTGTEYLPYLPWIVFVRKVPAMVPI